MHQTDIDRLNKYLSNSFPKVSLLISTSNNDKCNFISEVADKMQLENIDITENISNEFLNDLYLKTEGYIYSIDLDELSINKQNIILKFVEDCPSLSYIILKSSIKGTVLPTILTRCVEFELYRYTKKDIEEYVFELGLNDSLLVRVSNDLDDVDNFKDFDLKTLENLCKNIINNIHKATLPNTLSIAKKYLYFKEREQNKYSLQIFTRMLQLSLGDLFKDARSSVVYYLYERTVKFAKDLTNNLLSKEMLFDNFIIDLWLLSRGNYEN